MSSSEQRPGLLLGAGLMESAGGSEVSLALTGQETGHQGTSLCPKVGSGHKNPQQTQASSAGHRTERPTSQIPCLRKKQSVWAYILFLRTVNTSETENHPGL